MKKNIFFLLAALLFSEFLVAENPTTIYGLARNPSTNHYQLVRINPIEGNIFFISPHSFHSFQLNNNTIDPFEKVYYFVSNDTIWGIDITNGELRSNSKILKGSNDFFNDLIFNIGDSSIYGLSSTKNGNGFYLSKINPKSGEVQLISKKPVSTSVTNKSIAIDNDLGIYYLLTQNSLIGIDITTGEIISNVTPHGGANDFGFFIYNTQNKSLYGLSRKSVPGSFFLSKIIPHTGKVEIISNSPISNSIRISGQTIDYSTNMYHIQNGSAFLGIDLETGKLKHSPSIKNSDNFLSFVYSEHTFTGKEYGTNTSIYSIPPIKNTINIYPNPASNSLYVKTLVEGDFRVEITNMKGQKVLSETHYLSGQIKLDISSLSNGVYYIIVFQNGMEPTTEKIIVSN